MRPGEVHHGGVVLTAVEVAVLEVLSHGVQVVSVLSSSSGDVEDADG